mmetsp:Transcript_51872/g.150983  ORF Transcript_51872/g.150983 Transcript_51872/m.150983 type:complete len:467 (+) Transcript_51872:279-1679(+)
MIVASSPSNKCLPERLGAASPLKRLGAPKGELDLRGRLREPWALEESCGARPVVLVAPRALANHIAAINRRSLRRFRGLVGAGDVVQSEHNVLKSTIAPRLLCRGHLDERAAETPNVGFSPVALLGDDFGGHPWDGAQRGEGPRLGAPLRAPKVGQLHAHVQVDQDVGTLEVPVDDRRRVGVQVMEPLQHAERRFSERRPCEGAEFAEQRRERATWNILQVDVQVALRVVMAQVVDDILMAQALANAQLQIQPLALLGSSVAVLERRLLHCEDLQRLGVESLVDGAEVAGAEGFPAHPVDARPVAVATDRRRRGGGLHRRAAALVRPDGAGGGTPMDPPHRGAGCGALGEARRARLAREARRGARILGGHAVSPFAAPLDNLLLLAHHGLRLRARGLAWIPRKLPRLRRQQVVLVAAQRGDRVLARHRRRIVQRWQLLAWAPTCNHRRWALRGRARPGHGIDPGPP